MPQNINLVPSEVVKERALHQAYNKFVIFSLVILVAAFSVLGVFAYLVSSTQKQISTLNNEIAAKERELEKLKNVEKSGAILTSRLEFIQNLMNNKVYYSKVMEEIKSRTIPGIVVSSISVSDIFEISVSGTAASTTALQNYVTGLVAGPDNLFFDAKIFEVSVKEGGGTASFRVTVQTKAEEIVGVK